MAETKISDIIAQSLDSVRSIADANTVIGSPIETKAGTTIIPVSKVSVGLASGGVDYASKTERADKDSNFGGGGGTGLSVTPVAFIIVHADGNVEMLNVANPTSKVNDLGYNVSSLVDRAPEIISKIKAMIPKKKKAVDAEDAVEEPAENADLTGEAEEALL